MELKSKKFAVKEFQLRVTIVPIHPNIMLTYFQSIQRKLDEERVLIIWVMARIHCKREVRNQFKVATPVRVERSYRVRLTGQRGQVVLWMLEVLKFRSLETLSA